MAGYSYRSAKRRNKRPRPGDLLRLLEENRDADAMLHLSSPYRRRRMSEDWQHELQACACIAIAKKKAVLLGCLIEAGLDLYASRYEGCIPEEPIIHTALRQGDLTIADVVLRPEAGTRLTIGALVAAFASRNSDLVTRVWELLQRFYKKGAKVSDNNPINSVVEYLVGDRGCDSECTLIDEILEFLIGKGYDINEFQGGYTWGYTGSCNGANTPLLIAVREGNKAVVRALLKRGANRFIGTDIAAFPWELACTYSHPEVMQELLNDLSITEHRETFESFLHKACDRGWDEAVQYLLDRDVDVNCLDLHHSTALHIAVEKQRLSTIELLLKGDADVNCLDGENCTPLMLACKHRLGSETIIRYLIEKGADLNCTDSDNRTPLMCACKWDSTTIVRCLIEKGADLNHKDRTNQTAIIIACKHGSEGVVRCLIEAGTDVNCADSDNRTPLMFACERDLNTIVRCLIENGADLNHKDHTDQTPLMIACQREKTCLIELLLHNVDMRISKHQYQGTTPLQLAYETQNRMACGLLLDADCSVAHMADKLCSVAMTARMLEKVSFSSELRVSKIYAWMSEVRARIQARLDEAPESLKAQARLAVLGAIGQCDLKKTLRRMSDSHLLPKPLINYLGKAIKFNADSQDQADTDSEDLYQCVGANRFEDDSDDWVPLQSSFYAYEEY